MRLGFVAVLILALAVPATAAVPRYSVKIIKTFPHDPQAFTEGLFYDRGHLYESTGRNGTSSIREVDLDSGKVLKSADIDEHFFGEGIVPWNGRIVSLTWRSGIGFVWNQNDLRVQKSFTYTGEGWGMTHDARNLIMSDGTPALKFLDPDSLNVVRTLNVSYDGQPVMRVNELEWVDGNILANIWMTHIVVRIDPASGKVNGVVDLDALPEVAAPPADQDAVPNGIAFDPDGHRLFVTGKLWPHLYQVELVPEAAPQTVKPRARHGKRH